MNQYKSSAELKALAKEHMFGNYGTAISASLVVGLITGFVNMIVMALTDQTTVVGIVIYYLISFIISVLSGLFTSGITYFYLKLICGRPVSAADVFYGFRLFPDKTIIIYAWISILTYIALLPMTIISFQINTDPGNSAVMESLMFPYALAIIFYGVVSVIVSLFYSQALFLLHDFPQYSAKELLTMSRKLMIGHKGRMFYIYVSFIPLFLLSLLSCCIALLWVIPYMNATFAEFYLDIIRKSKN